MEKPEKAIATAAKRAAFLAKKAKRKQRYSLDDYVSGILAGNKIMLSQAITLIESTRADHQSTAQEIVEACLPHSKASIRIGITGAPGVGKSTFIESLGGFITEKEHRLAVLAIDPSSQLSKGSILGDKTRMHQLSNNPRAFIRPSAAGDSLGGVARKTRETIVLCEAAGFDTILVETVGVGQSEIAVHSMVDFFLLLLLPGAGDELQGIKRGIVEMADLIAVNKSDGDRLLLAKQTKQAYRNAIHLFPAKQSDWIVKVKNCSANTGMGIQEIWETIKTYQNFTQENQFFEKNRQAQAKYWLDETITGALKQAFFNHPAVEKELAAIEKAVLSAQRSPFKAAENLLKLYQNATKDQDGNSAV